MAERVTRAKLPLTTPLDLATTLFCGQDFRWKQEGDGYIGWLGDAPAFLRIVQGHLEVLSPLPEEEAHARTRRLFRMDDDQKAVQSALVGDPLVARAMGRWPGLRLLRLEPWPTLASFICTAHANIPRITRMVDALSQALGDPLDFLGRWRWRFPSPLALAHAGEERLRTLGLGFRSGNLWRTACLLAQGEVDPEALGLLPTEDLRQRLLALPGVGDKVADCVLLMGYGRTEAFPIDRWVRRALIDWYRLDPHYTNKRLREWAQARWGPYAGYAQLYLFHDRRTRNLL